MIINNSHIDDNELIDILIFLARENNEYKYLYLEGEYECNLCYEIEKECFKCKRCIFKACPKCFNNYYFSVEKSKCPMCRY